MKYLILLLVVFSVACSKNTPLPTLSANLHGLPEDGAADGEDDLSKDEASVAPVIEDYTDATSSALDESEVALPPSHAFAASDHVPWHMEYLLTDLSVSASGILGSLVMKGSPGITFIWRKQKPAVTAPSLMSSEGADLSITSVTTGDQMELQIEPAVRMAVASGRVKSESKLRASLLTAARDFQTLAGSIGENPGHDWWVSRLRLDLTLDATGAVTPVIGVGGDIRFWFEWHRIMKPHAPAVVSQKLLGIAPVALRDFIRATASDLAVLSDSNPRPDGFKAYSYRVGLGMSAKGDIGVVKSSAALMAQVYFSRDVAKPKVHSFVEEVLPETINVIENASAAHEDFAASHAIGFFSDSGQVVYKVDRKKIRKGLARAAKMGLMFGKHAASAKGHWKVFEMRTALDLSITGKVGVTEVAGLATSEINFYNQSF